MKKSFLIIAALICILLSSCATIMEDSTQTITIITDPQGAKVRVDGFERGITPTTVQLETKKAHIIELSKEGYQTTLVTIRKSLRWGYQVADLVLAPVVGNVIDLCTGDGFKLKPNTLTVYLEKQ
ncbi:MAG: PEGA domain-containing protein [Sphaerochaetaceae bacterium]|jgi:hypothetical protein|nr:PEGA domain-containing protein [Sphaerochaetaceae bacterium]